MQKRYSIILLMLIFAIIACQKAEEPTELTFSEWELVADSLVFPEGPAWDGQGNLYVSNCNSNWIARISHQDLDTFLVASDSTFTKTNGMTFSPDGDLIACDFGAGVVRKISPLGKSEVLIPGFAGTRFNKPNDLHFYDKEKIFFSEPYNWGPDKFDGRFFCFNLKTGELKLVLDSLAFPNGNALSPVDGHIYLSESAQSRVLKLKVDEEGNLLSRESFIKLPGGDPDGLAFDIQGNLYVAHFGTGTLFVISPRGKILHKIKTPGNKPSNIEFAGNDLKILYLTEDETNAIYKMKVSIAGQPLLKGKI